MSESERLLLESIRKCCVVKMVYEPRLTTRDVYYGVVSQRMASKNKYKLLFCDEKTAMPLLDDIGNPQTLTFDLKHVRSVSLMSSYVWEHGDKIKTPLPKERILSGSAALFESLFTTTSNTIVPPPQTPSLEDKKAVNTAWFENILSVKSEDKPLPVISRQLIFDMNARTWRTADLRMHREQPLNRYFKYVPETILDTQVVDTLKTLIKDGVDIDESTFTFMQVQALPGVYKKRLKTLFATPLNRPLKAYFNSLTPKNLGRKDYVLPFVKRYLMMLENQWAFSFLKHPVTLIEKHSTFNLQAFLQVCIRASILNNQTLLVVDPHGKTANDRFETGLSTLNEQTLSHAVDNIKTTLASQQDSNPLPVFDYEDFFSQFAMGYEWFTDMEMLLSYRNHATEYGLFHETIAIDSVIDELWNHVPVVDMRPVLNHVADEKQFTASLAEIVKKKHDCINRSSHRKIRQAFECDDEKNRYKAVLALLDKKHHFHQLKQLFGVLIVKETKILPFIKNAFDQVLLIDPTPGAILDLRYADKACVITTKDTCPSPIGEGGSSWVHERYFGSVFDVLKHHDNPALKKYPQPFEKDLAVPTIYHIDSLEESHPHQSNSEGDALTKRLHGSELSAIIRTPFNAQKRLLKSAGFDQVDTLHHPVFGKPIHVSWCLHKKTASKTYDWVKNNPHIHKTLEHAECIESYIDTGQLMRLSAGEDGVFEHVMRGLYPNGDGVGPTPFAPLLKRVLGAEFKAYLAVKPTLDKAFKITTFPIKPMHALYTADQTLSLLTFPFDPDLRRDQLMKIIEQASRARITVIFLSKYRLKLFERHISQLIELGCLVLMPQGGY